MVVVGDRHLCTHDRTTEQNRVKATAAMVKKTTKTTRRSSVVRGRERQSQALLSQAKYITLLASG